MFVFVATSATYNNNEIYPKQEYSMTEYIKGYNVGFEEGYMDIKGPYSVPPKPPLPTIPKKHLLTYKNVYIKGLKDGSWVAENERD